MSSLSEKLDKIFHPKSIAIIGASRTPGKVGYDFLKSLIDCGYKGKIYPINPASGEILNLKAYPSITDVPGKVDLAVIAVPAPIVPKVTKECAKKGVEGIIILSSGFSETGSEGKKREEEIVNILKGTGIRVIGPNCNGIYCHSSAVSFISSASVQLKYAESDPIAFISQSGSLCNLFRQMLLARGIKLDKFVSSGNEADLTATDYLEYFGNDPRIKIIAAYLECIRKGRKFLEQAKKISKKKPIIIWKAGRTKAGARAAFSHTAALSSSDTIYDAVFRQTGVIRAMGIDELVDFTVAFLRVPYPKGRNVAIISGPGGPAVAAADASEMAGLNVPELSKKTQNKLREFLPPFAGVRNPVDMTMQSIKNVEWYKIATDTVMRDENIDMVLIILPPPGRGLTECAKLMMEEKENYKKPIVFVCMAGKTEEGVKLLEKAGFSVFPTVERAAKALAVLVRYREYLESR